MAGEFGLTQLDHHQDCPMTQVLIFLHHSQFVSKQASKQALSTHPLSTPRIKFMTKKAPSTTMETK